MTKQPKDELHLVVEEWIDKAEEDFGAAEFLLSSEQSFYNVVAFHCQQSAEKYLKALLVRHQVEFPKTHDLEELLSLVSSVASKIALSLKECAIMTIYGVDIRYPDDAPEVSEKEAKDSLRLASLVREKVLESLHEFLKN